jgi:HD-GYP domain-containing protein (c-di-GMP phosphodiesterase class II)
MVEKSLAVLIAGRVDDVLVLRRLLRDTSYRVDGATSATQSLRAITKTNYAAVVADDETIVGLSGEKLLQHVEELQPRALRLLIARRERRPSLATAALSGRFQLFVRPYFATTVRDALAAHERAMFASSRRRADAAAAEAARSAAADAARAAAASATGDDGPTDGGSVLEDDTKPYAVVSAHGAASAAGSAVDPAERRRLLMTMSELAEATLGHDSGHAARVAMLAVALGRALGLGSADLEALDEAALLHDVGELATGLDLMRAPRRLNADELRAMQLHVEAGHQVAVRCGAAKQTMLAVRHHHERWDGRGYPNHLAGKEIPLLARVLAVADTFDALATNRPYKPKQAPAQCVKALRQAAGGQLDPQLVEQFLGRRLHESIDWSDPPRAHELLPGPPRTKVRARAG